MSGKGGKLIPLRTALVEASAGGKARNRDKMQMLERAALCQRLDALLDAGHSLTAAAQQLRAGGRELPADNTLRRWFAAWRGGGPEALVDRRAGRTRLPYGWEARCVEIWNSPTCFSGAAVADILREEGWPDATDSRVRRYLKTLPATVGGEDTRGRRGPHHYWQNKTRHVVRDATVLGVGFLYEGDGHTCDVYVQHPRTGKHYRPELTAWLDVRSRFCVGWWLSEAESAVSTMRSLSKAFVAHDHVPAALHVDPGSGFVNKMLSDQACGWLTNLGVTVMPTRPGNARGKGLVEGWFRIFEERCGKRFESHCGAARTDDVLRRIEASIKKGRLKLPSLRQFADGVEHFVRSYNATVQPGLKAAPAQVWRELERSPVGMSEELLMRPSELRRVRRATVQIHSRHYSHRALYMLDGRQVEVSYDLLDDARVWIDYNGRRVCEATKVKARPWLGESVIADLEIKKFEGQKRRVARNLAEMEARSRPVIDSQPAAAALDMLPEPEERAAEIDPFSCIPD